MGHPQNGWFILVYPTKMDDLGVLPILQMDDVWQRLSKRPHLFTWQQHLGSSVLHYQVLISSQLENHGGCTPGVNGDVELQHPRQPILTEAIFKNALLTSWVSEMRSVVSDFDGHLQTLIHRGRAALEPSTNYKSFSKESTILYGFLDLLGGH